MGQYPPIQIVDENDQPIGGASLEDIHSKGLLHRSVLIIAEDGNGNILLQKRGPNVATYPNVWDLSAAGHVDEGESYLAAAKREMAEELGLTGFELQEIHNLRLDTTYKDKIMKRVVRLYKVIIPRDTPLHLAADELAGVQWYSVSEVKQLIDSQSAELHPDIAKYFRKHFLAD